MLTVTDLRKEFSTVVAVDGVSFSAGTGEVFGLLGPNGAGKTTTIRMILNILVPDGGSVSYDGKPFSREVRDRIGYLPEERGLYRKSRLLDTIMYFAGLRGMKRAAARERALHWLGRFSLLEYRDRKVEELSKGNQQKVQFTCAIIHDPAIVILDEPFSGLDPVNQIVFKEIFQELRTAGKTVIFSTHQMDQAEQLSDALCLIHRGRVVLGGTLREVKKHYGANALRAEFSGDGAFMRSLPGVRRALMEGHAAELQLEEGANVQGLIAAINAGVEISRLALVEPSLQSIFLQVVGAANAPAGEAP